MFSIESDIKYSSSYSYLYPHNEHLCLLLGVSTMASKKEIEGYIYLVDTISKITNVVLAIDPRIKYDTVSKFQKKNVHILRIPLDHILSKQNSPFYLKNKEEKLLSVITSKELSTQNKKINHDLYIPNLIKEYELSKNNFNYDIFYDTALITLQDKKFEIVIKDFFIKVLKIKKCIFLYSKRKYFARFLNKETVIINANKNEENFEENIQKLSDFTLNTFDSNADILSNYFIQNNTIFIESTLFIKNKDVLNLLSKLYSDNIHLINFKPYFKNNELCELIVPIPYSSKHEYYDK